jgi:hypothetical protein
MQALKLSRHALLAVSAIVFAATAQADIRISIEEGAPKDRFTIENTGSCAINAAEVLLDMTTSRGKLIFDVTGAGAGVDVFQPFEIVAGAAALAARPQVLDGQSKIALNIAALQPGESIRFTIDVDDTLGAREITVTGAEIAGAVARYAKGGNVYSAAFSEKAVAEVAFSACD